MGMLSNVELKVRAFNEEAKKRVLEIDLNEYSLTIWEEISSILVVNASDLKAGRNDFQDLMEKIAGALNGEGMAYLIESVEEDEPFAKTYYYQGNGIKTKDFRLDPYEMEEEFDDPWEAAEKRHEIYIPRAAWARGKSFTTEEKELLKKYPW